MTRKYMIRKRFYVPQYESTQDYRLEGDLRSSDFIMEADLPENVSLEAKYESIN